MNEMLDAMIALQQQALDVQRRQIAMATKMMTAGQDLVTAQRKGAEAMQAGRKAMGGWLSLWGIR